MDGSAKVFSTAFTLPELEALVAASGFRVGESVSRDALPGETAARWRYVAATRR